MGDYGFSELECRIIRNQIERRAQCRQAFLRLRTDPCKHAQEGGYVFDRAMQQFLSMKATQFDHFQANGRTVWGAIMTLAPMFIYGYFIWTDRAKREHDIRCGKLKYRDRLFKLI